IIPPDQYFSVYLQVTRGCYWNRCTFCRLYKDRDYHIKDIQEFKDHLNSVKEYFGSGLKSRRTVFLGDANAVNIDQKLLISILDTVKDDLGLPVYSFIDAISTQKKKGETDFEEMARHGLKRVYLGMESGSPEVLRLLNKLMNVSEAINMVNKIKSSGMDIGLIVMAGAGGKKYYGDHVESTASVISQMDLGKGDIIYISPIIEYEDAEYFKISGELGTLSDDEKEKQSEDLKKSISEAFKDMNNREIGIPIVKYDLREAIY
ncbi:MAG: radical SAM protein, partial [Thermoplasmata archaeon]